MNQVNIQTTYVQREQRQWREIIHEKFPEVTDIRKHCYYQTLVVTNTQKQNIHQVNHIHLYMTPLCRIHMIQPYVVALS